MDVLYSINWRCCNKVLLPRRNHLQVLGLGVVAMRRRPKVSNPSCLGRGVEVYKCMTSVKISSSGIHRKPKHKTHMFVMFKIAILLLLNSKLNRTVSG